MQVWQYLQSLDVRLVSMVAVVVLLAVIIALILDLVEERSTMDRLDKLFASGKISIQDYEARKQRPARSQ